jgi:hypothetical protein
MERLRFLQRAHREGLITTDEYQLHKQRVLHFSSARHGAAISYAEDSENQFDATVSSVHSDETVKGGHSPLTASVVHAEQLVPLVDALNRLVSLLEGQLGAIPPSDEGGKELGYPACNHHDLSSTMIILPAQQADSAQYERAVLESESSRSRAVSGSSQPLSSPAAALDSTVGMVTDSLDTAPTEKNKKRRGRRFAFDRHGKSAISSDDTDVPTVPIDPLQVDVLKLMLETITPEVAAALRGSSSSTEEYEPQDSAAPSPHHAPAERARGGRVRDAPVPLPLAGNGVGGRHHEHYDGGRIKSPESTPGAAAPGVGPKPVARSPACFRGGGGLAAAYSPARPAPTAGGRASPGRTFVKMPSASRLAAAQDARRKNLR